MSFDSSRFTFDPWQDFLGVVMQQGRVQLDSDWNEWQEEFARRIQAGTLDIVGRAVVPATTPDAFKIAASIIDRSTPTVAGGSAASDLLLRIPDVTIGPGRMYVDGLLVENHGPKANAQWDPALAETSGAPAAPPLAVGEVKLDFFAQTYLPGAALPTTNGPFLFYLDVWRRSVTYLECPDLVEKAVGVDTTGRLQTVWQVKFLDVSSVTGGVTGTTPDSSIPQWQAAIQPSSARLTIPSSTGYTGTENQLYRVEIHQGTVDTSGNPTPEGPTFKWSRDNASVLTAVTVINNGTTANSVLTVQSAGRDNGLSFNAGNWIEITDDYLELNGQAGELHQIANNGAPRALNTIPLQTAVSSTLRDRLISGGYHTRICRWDQSGTTAGSAGIPVPSLGTPVTLENGLTVEFNLSSSAGKFNVGDFWTFAARASDGTVQGLTNAAPMGIHHHYARLAVVTFPTSTGAATVADCRVAWPPLAATCSCGCARSVQISDLVAGVTLQTIIDNYQNPPTFTEICLMPGTYSLSQPLYFKSSNIGLKACQEGTVFIQAQAGQESKFADGLVVLDNVANVSLRGIHFALPAVPFTAPASLFAGVPVVSLGTVQLVVNNLVVSIGVRPVNCSGLTIENCEFEFTGFEAGVSNQNAQLFGVGIFASGQSSDWRITGNTFEFANTPTIGNFMAGVLLAPQVTFNTPRQLQTGGTLPQPGGANIFTGGTSTANLAVLGGTMLPSSLDEAVFERNSFSGLTIATLVMSVAEAVRFTQNEIVNCVAGIWLLSPLQADTIPFDPNSVALAGLSIAMGYPLPQGDMTKTMTKQLVTVPAAVSVRIYTGSTTYLDSQGNNWLPDVSPPDVPPSTSFTLSSDPRGVLFQPKQPPTISGTVTPTEADTALYQSQRSGFEFSYTFNNLPAGYYQITLRFAEINPNLKPAPPANLQEFNVSINGTQVLFNFSVSQVAGDLNKAVDEIFNYVVPNAQGQIVVRFFQGETPGFDIEDQARVGAVAVEPQWNGVLPSTLQSPPEIFDFYWQLAQLAQSGFALGKTLTPPLRLRIGDNEIQVLSSAGLLVLGDDQIMNQKTGSVTMNGNRIATTLPNSSSQPATVNSPSTPAAYFINAAAITTLTRCVVSSNMIVNEALSTNTAGRSSFRLDQSTVVPPPKTVPPLGTIPSPEIMVSANVFQGTVAITPTGYPPSVSSWNVLNTIIP